MRECTTYNFDVKLEYLDEYKDKHESQYYCVQFQVLADDKFKAQRILEHWLSEPEQPGGGMGRPLCGSLPDAESCGVSGGCTDI